MDDKLLPNHEQEDEAILRRELKFKSLPITTDRAVLWERIQAGIAEEQPVRRLWWSRRPVLVLAASMALLLTLVFLWPSSEVAYQTLVAQTGKLSLPDDSRVTVNASSTLRYAPGEWERERRVHLEGEAFFAVEKGSRFIVETEQGAVEVLGTAFNVLAREQAFQVSCEEGRVRVRSRSGAEVTLEPGDFARIEGTTWRTGQLPMEAIATWRSGLFAYQHQSLAGILEEMERQFDVAISYPAAIRTEAFTMRFDLEQSLEEALEPILFAYHLSFEKKGRKVILAQSK